MLKSECLFHHGFGTLGEIPYIGVRQGDSKPGAEGLEAGTEREGGAFEGNPREAQASQVFQRIRGEIAFYF